MTDTIIIPVQRLEKKSLRKFDMVQMAREQCIGINGLISETNKLNKNKCVYKLPKDFKIPNVSIEDQQTFIYSELIEKLQDAGYTVKIDIDNPAETDLYISWAKSEEDAERDRRKKKIFSVVRRGTAST